MKSIWPDLGPGLHSNPAGGVLAPQIRDGNGLLADDAAENGFYIVAREPIEAPCKSFVGAQEWLDQHELFGVVIRPDGYSLGGFRNVAELPALLKQIEGLLV